MQPLTEKLIRSSFVNASRREVKEMSLPEGFDDLTEYDWDDLDYLGWRDSTFARRAYVVLPRLDADPVGIALKPAASPPRTRAMCNWCRDVRLLNEVVFFSAKRVGPAGRRGDTVGTLICRDFECSRNARNDPPAPYEGYDKAAARVRRIEDLQLKVAGFAEMLIAGR
ncbi:FBP domain-containing protein [Cumulibacter soli]|uniref:FBP domain-containing protein n=1 Tax=Cumulibacter soli TaxID=2546344 RepID=UPI00106786F4|nr:FBP domain-containing protein [Cumulibacter soli]